MCSCTRTDSATTPPRAPCCLPLRNCHTHRSIFSQCRFGAFPSLQPLLRGRGYPPMGDAARRPRILHLTPPSLPYNVQCAAVDSVKRSGGSRPPVVGSSAGVSGGGRSAPVGVPWALMRRRLQLQLQAVIVHLGPVAHPQHCPATPRNLTSGPSTYQRRGANFIQRRIVKLPSSAAEARFNQRTRGTRPEVSGNLLQAALVRCAQLCSTRRGLYTRCPMRGLTTHGSAEPLREVGED
jgi:hypothetical protein